MKYAFEELKKSCKARPRDYNGGYILALKDENILTFAQYDEVYRIMIKEQERNEKLKKGLI